VKVELRCGTSLTQESHLPGISGTGRASRIRTGLLSLVRQRPVCPADLRYRRDWLLAGKATRLKEFDARLARYLDGSAFTDKQRLLGSRIWTAARP
jgi:hypothetical protein